MRVGFVDIAEELASKPYFLEIFLPHCEVLEKNGERYTMGCPEFDDVGEGQIIPRYVFTWERRWGGDIIRLPVEKL